MSISLGHECVLLAFVVAGRLTIFTQRGLLSRISFEDGGWGVQYSTSGKRVRVVVGV